MSEPITMTNDKGNLAVVGECQVAEWEARGYKRVEDIADGQAAEDVVAASTGTVPFDEKAKSAEAESAEKPKGKTSKSKAKSAEAESDVQ